MNYRCIEDKLIIDCNFNKKLDKTILELIKPSTELIFSNYNILQHKKEKFKKVWNKYYDNKTYPYEYTNRHNYPNMKIYLFNKIELMQNYFNNKINNLSNLYCLRMGHDFNQKIDNLPQLHILELQCCFMKSINYLPSTLEILNAQYCVSSMNCNYLPNSLVEIKNGVNMKIYKFPLFLKKLFIHDYIKKQNKNGFTMCCEFANNFNNKIDYLPQSLKKLVFGKQFNNKILSIPESLIEIKFGMKYNQNISFLPDHILKITFGDYFGDKITRLPKSLIHVVVKSWQKELIKQIRRFNENIKIEFCFIKNIY